jgi:hypothetical protein
MTLASLEVETAVPALQAELAPLVVEPPQLPIRMGHCGPACQSPDCLDKDGKCTL